MGIKNIGKKEAVLGGATIALVGMEIVNAIERTQAEQPAASWWTLAQASILAAVAFAVRNKVWSEDSVEKLVGAVFVCENCDQSYAVDAEGEQLALDDFAEPTGDHEAPLEGK